MKKGFITGGFVILALVVYGLHIFTDPPTRNTRVRHQNAQAVSARVEDGMYAVSRVVDGDTIAVIVSGEEEKVRLIGINTPETVDPRRPVQCFGKEASNYMKSLLLDAHLGGSSGSEVRLVSDPTQDSTDKYGRLLRYVYLSDGTNINLKMIQDGYAYEYTYDLPYKYQKEFKKAQADAEINQKGLWATDTCGGKL